MKNIISAIAFVFFLMAANPAAAQQIPYGHNDAAGHYLNAGDARIYYEIYGKGKPIVLLHGGIWGYIDEFEYIIPKLAEHFQVICIATRGHGKSEIGHSPYSYQQRAEDAFKVIRTITKDSIYLLGFSDGAFSALKLTAMHPELVQKLISIGGGDFPKNRPQSNYHYTPEALLKGDSAFFKGRLALMPEPGRWGEALEMASKMYNEDFISTETFEKIKCPVLVMNGDRDDDNALDNVVKCYKSLAHAQLAIIPGCYHVVLYCNFPAVWESVKPFLSL